MIGQVELKRIIDNLVETKFPAFTIITGMKGQGKKLIAKYIANKLNYPIITIDTKIDSMREMIDLSYKQTEPIIYLIPDADRMSLGAKNSLLKVIEEPPNNAYFIMTLQTIENTLPTIKSRCYELKMNLYTCEELEQFIKLIAINVSDTEKDILTRYCDNYRDIELMKSYGIIDFYNYTKKVYDNIYKVQSANSFKICDKLNLKNEPDKYEVELFLRTFRNITYFNMLEILLEPGLGNQAKLLSNVIKLTSNILNRLSISGINRSMLLDQWIINIRKIWRTANEV